MSSTTDRPPRASWWTQRPSAVLLGAGGAFLAAILIVLAAAFVLPGLGGPAHGLGGGSKTPIADAGKGPGGKAAEAPRATAQQVQAGAPSATSDHAASPRHAASSRHAAAQHVPASQQAASSRHAAAQQVAAAQHVAASQHVASSQHAAAGSSHSSGARSASHARTAAYGPRDPEESRSFPVPASVQHASAAEPSETGRLIPAAGAASDSQVEQELQEVEKAESEGSHEALTTVPGGDSVGGNGTIPIPANVPEAVQRVIAGGNAIADFPYRYGGGHGSFVDDAYDCSGSVSYALAAAGLVSSPMVSGDLAHWGDPGPGRWITIYANAGHTFMDVDGIWFDTAGRSGPYDSRWLLGQPSLSGYAVRHPAGL